MRLLRPSRLLRAATGRLTRGTLAFLAPLALKIGVTQRVLSILLGVAVTAVVVLILLATGLFSLLGGG